MVVVNALATDPTARQGGKCRPGNGEWGMGHVAQGSGDGTEWRAGNWQAPLFPPPPGGGIHIQKVPDGVPVHATMPVYLTAPMVLGFLAEDGAQYAKHHTPCPPSGATLISSIRPV